LRHPATVTPSFVADTNGTYSVQLVVTDSLGTASSPSVVTASFNDVAPLANAGASQSAIDGQAVTLDGSQSTDSNGAPLSYKWSVVSAPGGSTARISKPTAQIASFSPDVAGTFVIQLIVNDGILNSLPATTEIMAVNEQTVLTQQIHSLQGVITNLPARAFRKAAFQESLLIEFNTAILRISAHNYPAALQLLQGVILPQVDGCATTGAPDATDWIVDCPDQSSVYTPLLNIIAEVKAL
jgi:hypothetical protein